MNDVVDINTDIADTRDISVVTEEILALKRQTLACAVEIGRRLVQAKQMLPHGEWGDWLQNEVDFSQSSANNMMKLFKEYGSSTNAFLVGNSNSQALANLSITNALRLLSAPENEREELAEKAVNENLSSRELANVIKERDEARKAQKEAEKLASEAQERNALAVADMQIRLDEMTKELHDGKDREHELSEQIETLKNEPIDIPTGVNDAELEKAKAAGVAERDNEIEELEKRLQEEQEKSDKFVEKIEALQLEIDNADVNVKIQVENAVAITNQKNRELAQKLEDAEKKLGMSDPTVAQFKELFNEVQRMLGRLRELADSSNDNEDKLNAALDKLLETFSVH